MQILGLLVVYNEKETKKHVINSQAANGKTDQHSYR